MTDLIKIIEASALTYGIFFFLDNILTLLLTVFLADIIFKIRPSANKKVRFILPVILTGMLSALCALSRFGFAENVIGDGEVFDFVTLNLIVSVFCVCVLYFKRKEKKNTLKALFCYLLTNITGAVKYLVCMFFSDFMKVESSEETLDLQIIIDIISVIIVLGVHTLLKKKKRDDTPHFEVDITLYLLIFLTASVFVVSMIFIGANFNPDYAGNYWLVLLNIPMVSATLAYAFVKMAKSSAKTEKYKIIIEDQVKYYKMLEEKNEEAKIFRHDFPKIMDPLLMYIKDGNNEEAAKIVENLQATVKKSKVRYMTGNPQLDVVLECEAQKAEKNGIKIVLTPGSVFPAGGINPEDIYTIFPNALDNAIEACVKLGVPSTISFTSKIKNNCVIIRITNPFTGKIQSSGETPATSKPDKENHGYGFRSMKKAAENYGKDNVFYEIKNGAFELNILLTPKE